MNRQLGRQSLRFEEAPFLFSYASIGSGREEEGPLGEAFDAVCEDGKFGEKTWEESESTMQKEALTLAIGKAGMKRDAIRYLFAGDLLGQTMASAFGLKDMQIPWFGVYGACSTSGETLSLASMSVAAGYADTAAAVTSSHFGSAEKQFRFPLEYAQQRPVSSTWTVTGSGAFLLGTQAAYEEACEYRKKADKKRAGVHAIRVSGVTTGKMVDYGIKDSMNMGAAMAPAACDTIVSHLQDFGRQPSDYDAIVTGDLGKVGKEILLHLAEEQGFQLEKQHEDCGLLIYDCEKQETDSGGSGCGCSAVTLANHYLPSLENGLLKRILFVPTGALISKISFNQGLSIPGIAHAVVIEAE